MTCKFILFNLICLIHVLFWIFIILAFLRKKLAKINLYLVIPFTYLLHILPFHILNKFKELLFPDTFNDKISKFDKLMIIPIIHKQLTAFLDKHCTFNPVSPQGMLLFGAISSAYTIKFNKNLI